MHLLKLLNSFIQQIRIKCILCAWLCACTGGISVKLMDGHSPCCHGASGPAYRHTQASVKTAVKGTVEAEGRGSALDLSYQGGLPGQGGI